MQLERFVKLTNKYGLHARASTRLAQLARTFDADVRVTTREGNECVDAKSILGLLTLGAERGTEVVLTVKGQDAEAAMNAIVQLFERKFDEE